MRMNLWAKCKFELMKAYAIMTECVHPLPHRHEIV